jgi:chromate reductase, NAD(P)H dehydrogenase (quinone)
VRIVGLGGSLRAGSWNRALLREAVDLMPDGAELDLGLAPVPGSLPLFNEDLLDGDGAPAAVAQLKDGLRAADGLLIATPEYNRGIPGFLKNAIDWASRPAVEIPEVFGDLPVALVGVGGVSGTRNAQSAWMSVFRYLEMRPWLDRSLFVDRPWQCFDEDSRLVDDATREGLRAVVEGFAAHCEQVPRGRPS